MWSESPGGEYMSDVGAHEYVFAIVWLTFPQGSLFLSKHVKLATVQTIVTVSVDILIIQYVGYSINLQTLAFAVLQGSHFSRSYTYIQRPEPCSRRRLIKNRTID